MSNLTFANVASDIQSTAKIPFDIDDFLSDHGVQLSSKVRGKLPIFTKQSCKARAAAPSF